MADTLLLSALEWLAAPTGTVQPAHGVGFTREERLAQPRTEAQMGHVPEITGHVRRNARPCSLTRRFRPDHHTTVTPSSRGCDGPISISVQPISVGLRTGANPDQEVGVAGRAGADREAATRSATGEGLRAARRSRATRQDRGPVGHPLAFTAGTSGDTLAPVP